MESYLEHVNITVIDVDEAIRFLLIAMPDWKVRADVSSEDSNCRRWVHVGTDTNYIAIEDRGATERGKHEPYVDQGVNHIGFVVKDIDSVAKRLTDAGYGQGLNSPDNLNRRRIYFYDADENEYEFVEYLKSDIASRNDYSDA
jgi:predicted enzyme related to lactoylglutathione lyase|tara:strand:- start:44 stop:472 length:429 start_codon:yes stop_codon:yes gene_type:complete